MKRFTSLLSKQKNSGVNTDGDSPVASVTRGVRLFCESGGPNNSGDEVLHLPAIVDAAESSPAAAKEAANIIRTFLTRENSQRAYVQYNAIMLVRILADNPGKSFTRNLNGKFLSTTKELLREGRDISVQQILRETLDMFQLQRGTDETLVPLITMWQNEKAKAAKLGHLPAQTMMPRTINPPPNQSNNQQNYFSRNHGIHRGLPPPQELASRIEEARTSSKLLLQVVQSTPPHEVLCNDLIKEFADRCQSASRSLQGYINCDSPAPDEHTLLTLIETNDQIAMAISKHQRAILQARRLTGQASPSPPIAPPPGPPPSQLNTTLSSQSKLPSGAPLHQTTTSYQPTFPVVSQPQPTRTLSPQPGLAASADSRPVPPAGPPPQLAMPRRQEKANNPFDDLDPSTPNNSNNLGSGSSIAGDYAAIGPYHPGYRPTPSYVHRQESSANNVTMYGAGAEPKQEENNRPVQYRF